MSQTPPSSATSCSPLVFRRLFTFVTNQEVSERSIPLATQRQDHGIRLTNITMARPSAGLPAPGEVLLSLGYRSLSLFIDMPAVPVIECQCSWVVDVCITKCHRSVTVALLIALAPWVSGTDFCSFLLMLSSCEFFRFLLFFILKGPFPRLGA